MRVRVEEVGESDVEETQRRQDGARRDESHNSGCDGDGAERALFDLGRLVWEAGKLLLRLVGAMSRVRQVHSSVVGTGVESGVR